MGKASISEVKKETFGYRVLPRVVRAWAMSTPQHWNPFSTRIELKTPEPQPKSAMRPGGRNPASCKHAATNLRLLRSVNTLYSLSAACLLKKPISLDLSWADCGGFGIGCDRCRCCDVEGGILYMANFLPMGVYNAVGSYGVSAVLAGNWHQTEHGSSGAGNDLYIFQESSSIPPSITPSAITSFTRRGGDTNRSFVMIAGTSNTATISIPRTAKMAANS